jgi:hypothetical protein
MIGPWLTCRFTELPHALAKRLADVAKLAGLENDQHDGENQDQVCRLKSTHE